MFPSSTRYNLCGGEHPLTNGLVGKANRTRTIITMSVRYALIERRTWLGLVGEAALLGWYGVESKPLSACTGISSKCLRSHPIDTVTRVSK